MTKKLIILITFLFLCSQITFGQTKTENKKGTKGIATGGYKPNKQETPPKTAVTYENRNYQNECYKSFAFIVKNYGYNKDGKFYSWGVSVKNNYSEAVQLKYKLIVGNDNTQNGTLTYYIKPGETYSNDMGTAKAIIVNNNSDQYKIEVSEVCFEGQDCNKNGYLDCNGRQNSNNNQKENNNTYESMSVDELPTFPGGISLFRQKVSENFNFSNVHADGKVKIEVSFVINEDGSISDIIAYGDNLQLNNVAIEAVNAVKEKWSPAKLNRKNVKYRFKMPFTLNFE